MARSTPDGLIDPTIFGDVLIRLRRDRSQRFVAKKAGIPTGTWCQWEKGHRVPRRANCQKILKALDCTQEAFDIAIWKEMTSRLKSRGSEVVTFEPTLFGRDLARLASFDLDTVPEPFRPSLRRMRHILEALCIQIEPLLAEYEALFLALRNNQ